MKTKTLMWTILVCIVADLFAAMPCMAQEEQSPASEVTAAGNPNSQYMDDRVELILTPIVSG